MRHSPISAIVLLDSTPNTQSLGQRNFLTLLGLLPQALKVSRLAETHGTYI